jgi:hypothetical protein
LKEEQLLYDSEGLGLKKITYIDNQDCIGRLKHLSSNDILDRDYDLLLLFFRLLLCFLLFLSIIAQPSGMNEEFTFSLFFFRAFESYLLTCVRVLPYFA